MVRVSFVRCHKKQDGRKEASKAGRKEGKEDTSESPFEFAELENRNSGIPASCLRRFFRIGSQAVPRLFPACNGNKQSPIDIETSSVKRDRFLTKLIFFGYDTAIKQADIVNDGHTVMITPRDNVRLGVTFQGRDYNLLQLHFHWDSEKNPGAEHTLNRRRFEMLVP
ncbi:hypothetical protein AVEN_103353-1 [Araneus ventricosus]|uniref:carbonic anhydrase n=1 Tax=Araneus ventricosus TaxID=182803 RepID=A0A4Y2KC99_ARAVE|nr:hypothetical protein AVEN_103353-1 [Araneus ventricosus]